MSEFEPIIGLEVHAQLLTQSKMFCSCSAAFGAEPNTLVCPVCLGLPGALPVVNAKAVESAVRMGVATHCRIAPRSVFARKNYFYPDNPKNYQISQYENPLCSAGYLELEGAGRRIGITRIHLEEDAGKLLHVENSEYSHVDMNRVGVPLIEIVSEPDLRTPAEASQYLQLLRSILRYLDICDGNMEEGSLRCDVNISLRRRGDDVFGTKTEVKNLNSFKAVEQALEFEIERQARILDDGGSVDHATLLWDDTSGAARIMRSKEEAHDYRYFPEPDLLVLQVRDELIERARKTLPELPDAKARRFEKELGLPPYDAQVLTASKDLADYYETTATLTKDPKAASNFVMGDVLRELNERKIDITDFRVAPQQLADLIGELKSGRINMPTARAVLKDMADTGADAVEIVKDKGLEQISDAEALERVVGDVLDEHPDEVAKYLSGKEQLLQFLVGQVMKKTSGKAHPQKAAGLLKEALDKRR